MKPSELIKVLQKAVDAGQDDNCRILFDTEARQYTVHCVRVEVAFYEPDVNGAPAVMTYSSDTNDMEPKP